MRQLLPDPEHRDLDLSAPDLRESELGRAYRWAETDRLQVRANMITSLDGRVTRSGRSGGLGNPADQRLLGLLRRISDVVLVGAGTVLAEGYTGLGLQWSEQPPPLAVVTSRPLAAEEKIFTVTRTPPILVTTAAAAPSFDGYPAQVLIVGADRVDPAAAVGALAAAGMTKVLCEGGPTLLSRLLAAGLVDELCLTLAPVLVGVNEHPLIGSDLSRDWRLRSMFVDGSHVFTRYRRAPSERASEPQAGST